MTKKTKLVTLHRVNIKKELRRDFPTNGNDKFIEVEILEYWECYDNFAHYLVVDKLGELHIGYDYIGLNNLIECINYKHRC